MRSRVEQSDRIGGPKKRVAHRPPTPSASVHGQLAVREGLRAVLFTQAGGEVDFAAMKRLERASAHAALRASFRAGRRPELTPDGVLSAALSPSRGPARME